MHAALPLILLVAQNPSQSTVAELAPFLKAISTQADSPGRVACRDADMAFALKKEGVSLDARSKVAWAQSTPQVQAFVQEGKFVIVGSVQHLAEGASLALVREGGKLTLVLHAKHAKGTGVALSDNLLKLVRIV